MLCARPFRTNSGEFGCGQCKPCRINRRRLWTARMVLESWMHAESAFVTLTYAENPVTLVPEDLQKYLKRLRHTGPFRFFGCGEYGEKNGRPHYHLALFGVGCYEVDRISGAWAVDGVPIGGVHVGELTHESAQYCTGYISKRMTSKEDPRLEGKHPEFSRMSLRPHGIGYGAVQVMAERLMEHGACIAVAEAGDVPTDVRVQRRVYPLGRYLRRALREAIGWKAETPQVILQFKAEMERSLTVEERAAREVKRGMVERLVEGRVRFARSRKVL